MKFMNKLMGKKQNSFKSEIPQQRETGLNQEQLQMAILTQVRL